VFENRVLRRIFGAKRNEVTGEWRKLHNEELHILYSSPNIKSNQIKENEVGGTCGTHGRGLCTAFSWESQKERDHWEDRGIDGRMGSEWILGRLAWGGVNWIRLAQDRDRWRAVVSTVMNLRGFAPRSYLVRNSEV
jgi:hypothetical protein